MKKPNSYTVRLSREVLDAIGDFRLHPTETPDSALRRKFRLAPRVHWRHKKKGTKK